MKLVLNLLVTVLAFTTISAAAFDQPTASTPELIAENKYVCSKPLKYVDSDGAIKEDQVFFIFEKLTFRNVCFWEQYTQQQKEGTALKDGENPKLNLSKKISVGLEPLIGSVTLFTTLGYVGMTEETPELIEMNNAIISLFEGSDDPAILNLLDERQQTFPYDIWMSYSTRKDPRTNDINNDDIEMVMSVFANQNCPFTTHLGISRNYLFCLPEAIPHKEMSMQLHASAAVSEQQFYGFGVQPHMITRPTLLMADLMEKKLNFYESFWKPCDMACANKTYRDPLHKHDTFPLDNCDSIVWKLAVSEREVRAFPRPLWFPHGKSTGQTIGEHGTLGEHGLRNRTFGVELVAVSMPALFDIWYKPVE